jgi:putative ATP-binding cassette transporter
VIDYWTDNDRYERLAAIQSEQQIPEYRIAEGVRLQPAHRSTWR